VGITAIFRHRLRGCDQISLGCNGGIGKIYTLALVSAASIFGAKVALHHHSFGYINVRSSVMAAICYIGGRRVEHVFLGPSMQTAFFALYPQRAPAHVLANALFVPPQPVRVTVPGRLTIGLLSNLSRDKGLYDFIATAERLHGEGLEVDLVLAGPVGDPADAEAIAKAEAAGFLRNLGPLYGDAKTAFFASIDLFLFPTRYRHEAQPTVIYEAFAAGVPVIAFSRGCIADQVKDCLAALPQNADFPSEVVDRCRDLSQLDAAGWEQLHAEARQRHTDDARAGGETLAVLFEKEFGP
jgi:glycosyltransferase involved in cell wall biosynthesis